MFLISIIIYLLLTKKEYKYLIPLLVFALVLFIYQYLYLHIGLVSTISNILKLLIWNHRRNRLSVLEMLKKNFETKFFLY